MEIERVRGNRVGKLKRKRYMQRGEKYRNNETGR